MHRIKNKLYLVLAIVWGFPFWIKAQFTEDFICIDSANLVIMYKLEYKSDSTMVKGHYEEKMILMIGDSRNHYNFQMISIKRPLERVAIEIADKVRTKTTKKKFFKVQDECRENLQKACNRKTTLSNSTENGAYISYYTGIFSLMESVYKLRPREVLCSMKFRF